MSKSKSRVAVGVVGTGHLGERHLRNVIQHKTADCSGFVDSNNDTAQRISKETNANRFSSLDELLSASDAVIVAVPTSDHFSVGKACLEQGKHLFMEKPICSTLEEADRLVELAAQEGKVLQVGHVERLNPAVLTLKEANIPLEPRYIETHRLAPYRVRGTEVPVVLDLMIHDLDVILSLVDSPVKRVSATGVSMLKHHLPLLPLFLAHHGH